MESTEAKELHDTHHDADGHGADQHHDPGFWRKYIFSTDHKIIGIQYGITSLLFMLFGFFLIATMRWSMAYPGQPMPVVGSILHIIMGDMTSAVFDPETKELIGYAISNDLYNAFGAMHGTIMVFLAVVPLAFAAFGNYVVPLQIGAVDMAFPRLNMASYHLFLLGGLIMLASFFIPGGPAQAGWTSYSPLATSIQTDGQLYWLIA
ncbi:cbb3-type cytochrome c oxidase subunit I, partial [Verrucomicrobia bacterium]|nr:cbb3-type cytochrome c oxidase subunit I [Verrucomicrobiota bacterium]